VLVQEWIGRPEFHLNYAQILSKFILKERVGTSLYHRVYCSGHVASGQSWVLRNTEGRKVCMIKVLACLYVLFEHTRNRIDWTCRRIDWISKWLLMTSRSRGKPMMTYLGCKLQRSFSLARLKEAKIDSNSRCINLYILIERINIFRLFGSSRWISRT
jgi:hypothetical protein